jgi:hypothetical protein
VFGRAIHATGWLVEADGGWVITAVEDGREGKPLSLPSTQIVRMPLFEPVEPHVRERLCRGFVSHALVEEVIPRVLQQERHPATCFHLPASRLIQPGGVPQQS